jgi:hypothetical protein
MATSKPMLGGRKKPFGVPKDKVVIMVGKVGGTT